MTAECWVCGEELERIGSHMRTHEEDEIRESLLDHLQNVADSIGRSPTINEINEWEGPAHDTFTSRWGSWNETLRAAGLEVNLQMTRREAVGTNDLIKELERLTGELGRVPTLREMDEIGKYSDHIYCERFNSWKDALSRANIPDIPSRNFLAEDQDLINALQEMADGLGRPPSSIEMEELGEYGHAVYAKRFGSWVSALEEAGFDVIPHRPELSPRGPDHPQWKGGSKPYGKGWNERKRISVRERDGFECQRCGMTQSQHLDIHDTRLPVHHITPASEVDSDRERNSMDNLVTLCSPCHMKVEHGKADCPSVEAPTQAELSSW